ncbi:MULTISPECIES: hypothetical protein [Bradyrhizobium]|uniref:hypothetical protein n=1 Tax=Bradyrhizobium TaxID=374 RepID=UPI000A73D943|nr:MULTISPECIES: hypothetical protein [Bradyrhizobium]
MASKKSPPKSPPKKGKASGFVIGSARFRKISSVEGIIYSPRMKGSSAIVESKARTPEERRKAIIKAYRKA